jgi:hypothetical protein
MQTERRGAPYLTYGFSAEDLPLIGDDLVFDLLAFIECAESARSTAEI